MVGVFVPVRPRTRVTFTSLTGCLEASIVTGFEISRKSARGRVEISWRSLIDGREVARGGVVEVGSGLWLGVCKTDSELFEVSTVRGRKLETA